MVTRSNGFPLADTKAPSLVASSRIGPRTLQGPHQLRGGCRKWDVSERLEERCVLCVKVCYDDLVLDPECLFETLMDTRQQRMLIRYCFNIPLAPFGLHLGNGRVSAQKMRKLE